MDFTYTQTQDMVRDSLARFLADHYDFAARQKILAGNNGRDPAIWAALASELGILGASFPEQYGGLGGGHIENSIIMEELGKVIAIEPYLQTIVIGGGALKAAGGPLANAIIPEIIAGKAIIAFAYAEAQGRYNLSNIRTSATKGSGGYILNGHKAVVYAAPWATHLLVTARTSGDITDNEGISLFLIDTDNPNIIRRDYPTVDGFQASEIYFENVSLPLDALLGEEGAALPLIEQLADEAIISLCAEACGVTAKLHEATLLYTQQRQQFGMPISRFQVLQHRMVDMFMEVEQAKSMTVMGLLKLDAPANKRMAATSLCKAKVSRACNFVGQNAVQTHGGIGITEELPIGHYFKRATMIENQFGSADHHLSRYENIAIS